MSSPDKFEGRGTPPISINSSVDRPVKERLIDKDTMTVLPIWLGQRMLDNSDYSAFERALYAISFTTYQPFMFTDADKMKAAQPYLGPMELDLKKFLNHTKGPSAVFVITTAEVAGLPWCEPFIQRLKEHQRKFNQQSATFFYKIIMGGTGFLKADRKEAKGKFNAAEATAHGLNAVWLYYNTDAPTAGSERLVEFMNRVLGKDLPGREFPDYSSDELQKMAWNITRESFNALPKEGSIPKYSIGSNGRPIFPF